ncbi:hypothetical protein L1987_01703 [Smallanthus sonchifolius]|uniref:Uncharacterized protein n=1 Tax=Smallanthus sonchifolius TaxID=185202 RepID=A0ACB9K5V5_9ASTR|nr:hypothetical protein L1987_01703 [Smallanthus sonchifolius]
MFIRILLVNMCVDKLDFDNVWYMICTSNWIAWSQFQSISVIEDGNGKSWYSLRWQVFWLPVGSIRPVPRAILGIGRLGPSGWESLTWMDGAGRKQAVSDPERIYCRSLGSNNIPETTKKCKGWYAFLGSDCMVSFALEILVGPALWPMEI